MFFPLKVWAKMWRHVIYGRALYMAKYNNVFDYGVLPRAYWDVG